MLSIAADVSIIIPILLIVPGFPMNKMNDEEMIIRKRLSMPLRYIPKPEIPNVMLDTESSQQFLYRLVPKSEQARLATNIGKLDIVWRSAMGERGRLQTSQLQRQVGCTFILWSAKNEIGGKFLRCFMLNLFSLQF